MKSPTIPEATRISSHLWFMSVVFSVSLFAASFPSLSRRSSQFSAPRILFFVGKHFGTGVILSTAFVHLLQDAFVVLTSKQVKRISGIGHWTGLVVLGSLLTIFCIEYASFAYVSRLDSDPDPEDIHHCHSHDVDLAVAPTIDSPTLNGRQTNHEHTPLIRHHTRTNLYSGHTNSDCQTSSLFESHHHFETQTAHTFHYRFTKTLSQWFTSSPTSGKITSDTSVSPVATTEVVEEEAPIGPREQREDISGPSEGDIEPVKSNRKRQIVGILVLQLGIMIHSVVIGLAISVSTGAEFTSLVTAITFHQLFEGLSLGTRIATLPVSSKLLPSVLALSFAVTVPIGVLVGLFTLNGANEDGNCMLTHVDNIADDCHFAAKMQLIQGLMAAISAGTLIYAACVEMLAGDFIMDSAMWKSSIRKQVLAVGSMIVGAGAMSVIAYFY